MPLFTKPRSAVRAIATARLFSYTGSAAAYIGLNFVIYEKTHSPVWVSASLFLTFGVAGLAGVLAGGLGDRFDRRKVMIISDLLAAVFFLAMAFVDDPYWLLAFAFLSAVAESPMWSASGAAIPALVGKDDLTWANSMISIGSNAGIMLGPAIGGVLVGIIGAPLLFGANAVSFLISAGIVCLVRGNFSEERSDEDEHRGVRAGLRFLWKDHVLRRMNIAWTILVLGMGLVMVADLPFANLLGAGSAGYGFMIAGWGAGSVLGALLGTKLKQQWEASALVWGTFTIGLVLLAVSVSPWFVPVVFGIFISGTGDALTLVAEQSITQRRTPDAVRSRVIAGGELLIHIALATSFVFAGTVVEAIGPRGAYAIGGVATLLAVVYLWPVRKRLRAEARGRKQGEAAQAVDPVDSTQSV